MKKTILAGALLLVTMLPAMRMLGQALPTATRQEIDIALTYNEFYSHLTTNASFWQQGLGADVHVVATKHWGVAGLVSGQSSNNLAGTGVDLSQLTFGVGPRYTVHARQWVVFCDALVGKAYATENAFPTAYGEKNSTNSLALQGGGGADFSLTQHFSVRAVEAHWLRTRFPNATTNAQNSFQLGAGIVYRP